MSERAPAGAWPKNLMMRLFLTAAGVVLGALLMVARVDARTIVVSGDAPKELRISFRVVYIVTNKTKVLCQDYNFLAGRWTDQTKDYVYDVPNPTGRYKIELPLSELSSDSYCKWRPLEIRYTVAPAKPPPGADLGLYRTLLSIDKIDGKPLARIELVCNAKGSLACWGQKGIPNLLNTITPDQRSLTVDFVMSAER